MKNNLIKILFIVDIVGRPGRRSVKEFLDTNKQKYDLIFANAENLSSGRGITIEKYLETLSFGIDYFTSGNHIWSYEEFVEYLNDPKIKVLRPANYPDSAPGRGLVKIPIKGTKVILANLQGRVFMKDEIDDPFIVAKEIANTNKDSIIIIDFHAEATSEKIALGYYLDGMVSVLVGTHTHIQTADEHILEHGTAYISDIGMCGPEISVLGIKKEIIIEKFLTAVPISHKVARGDSLFNAVEIEIDIETKKAVSIKRVKEIFKVNS
jgi:2',3'-cyclic-nucleotide 2'-phosphodiesterase